MQELNRTNDVKLPIDEQMNEVGGLPPRSEYHKKRKKKKKFKIPAIKTLAFAFFFIADIDWLTLLLSNY